MVKNQKRVVLALLVMLMAFSFVLVGCDNPTNPLVEVEDDTTTDDDTTGGDDTSGDDTSGGDDTTGDASGAPTSIFIGNYEVETDFKMHVWSNTHELSDTANGIKVTANSVGWSGGSFAARVSDDGFTTGFNFADVKTLTFKVRGSISTDLLFVFLQAGATDINKKSLSEHGVASLSETDWTTVSISVDTSADVTSAFSHVFEAPTSSGTWAEFGGIDWLDASGNSVNILN